jgi:hypothetical protein
MELDRGGGQPHPFDALKTALLQSSLYPLPMLVMRVRMTVVVPMVVFG